MDVFEILAHVEGYAVEHLARGIVHYFELDMLELVAYKTARAEVSDTARAEHRLLVAGAKRVEKIER